MRETPTPTLAMVLRRLDDLAGQVQELKPSDIPRALTLPEVAESLGVSLPTVKRMCDRRELRYVQAGPRAAKRVLLTDLHAWIKKNSVNPVRQ